MLFAGPRSPAVPTVPVSGTGVTALSQNSIGALFVDVVAELEPKLASLLRRKLVMAQVVPDPADAPLPSGREAAALRAQQSGVFSQLIQAAHDHGKNAAILRLAELDTKLIDVQWRARRSVSIRLLALAADNGAAAVGDTFDEICARIAQSPMPRDRLCREMQSLVDNCSMSVSLTTHPTNPTSLAYTQAALELERVLCCNKSTLEQVRAALRAIRDTPLDVVSRPSRKKTTEEETEELIAILSVMDDSVMRPTLRLRQALNKHGFGNKVRLRRPLCDASVWGAGDGDGNPNQTASTLLYQVLRMRCAACSALLPGLSALLDHASFKAACGEELHTELQALRGRIIGEIRAIHPTPGAIDERTGLPQVLLDAKVITDSAEEKALKQRLLAALQKVRAKVFYGETANSSGSKSAAVPASAIMEIHERAYELRHRVLTFGFHLATTDVRHNSVDMQAAAGTLLAVFRFKPLVDLVAKRLLHASGAADDDVAKKALSASTLYAEFQNLSDTQIAALLQQALLSEELKASIHRAFFDSVSASQLAGSMYKKIVALAKGPMPTAAATASLSAEFDEACEIAARLLGRTRVMALFPAAFQKLIIAETRGPSHFLAALFLLKAGGGVVGEPGASVVVTPLFESRQDLENAATTMNLLLHDPLVLRHVECCALLIVMIAKSDTARLSGSAVQGSQEACYASLLAINERAYSSQRRPDDGGADTRPFQVAVFLGGGEDQMRGGGRIVESPNVVLSAASRNGVKEVCRLYSTIQGIQLQSVFGSVSMAEYSIEAFSSQSLLANAKIRGILPWRAVPPTVNPLVAVRQTELMFASAQRNYEEIVGTEGLGDTKRLSVITLFAAFPKSILAAANKSSRPGARKKTLDPLQGRAIGVDLHSKHGVAYATGTAGVAAALLEMNRFARAGTAALAGAKEDKDKDKDNTVSGSGVVTPLRHAFLGNKSFRDFCRLQSVILFQKDYYGAWLLRGGVPKTAEERARLVAGYVEKEGHDVSAREFLAWMEDMDHLEASLLFNAITGKAPVSPTAPIEQLPRTRLDAPLLAGWPYMTRTMRFREQQCAFARHCELLAARLLNMQEQQQQQHDGGKKKPSTEEAFLHELAYLSYCGANVALSSPSFNMSITSQDKEASLRAGFVPFLKRNIEVPQWVVYNKTKAAKL